MKKITRKSYLKIRHRSDSAAYRTLAGKDLLTVDGARAILSENCMGMGAKSTLEAVAALGRFLAEQKAAKAAKAAG